MFVVSYQANVACIAGSPGKRGGGGGGGGGGVPKANDISRFTQW